MAITCTTCTWYKRCTSGTSSMAASWSNSRHESSQAILPLRGSHYERIRSHLHHPFKPSRAYLSLAPSANTNTKPFTPSYKTCQSCFCSGIVFVQKLVLKCTQERGSLKVGLQSQKNPVSVSAMLTGKFLQIRKVFATSPDNLENVSG